MCKNYLHKVKNILRDSMENRIRIYRVMHDLTQKQLAKRVGVTRQTINAIEKGKINPSLELAMKIARVFDIKIEELFKE